jgi:hypothetical protein
MLKKEAPIG